MENKFVAAAVRHIPQGQFPTLRRTIESFKTAQQVIDHAHKVQQDDNSTFVETAWARSILQAYYSEDAI